MFDFLVVTIFHDDIGQSEGRSCSLVNKNNDDRLARGIGDRVFLFSGLFTMGQFELETGQLFTNLGAGKNLVLGVSVFLLGGQKTGKTDEQDQ